MSLTAAIGKASAMDGREASAQAVRQALSKIERLPTALAWIFAACEYPLQSVLGGAEPLLGDIPMVGISTRSDLTAPGPVERSVVVALLAGEGVKAQAGWWPNVATESPTAIQTLTARFERADESPAGMLWLAADGMAGDFRPLLTSLPEGAYTLAGGLASGSHQAGRTYQIGGKQGGYGGLGGACLCGPIQAGVSNAHGWQPFGTFYRVTDAEGPWVRTLDGQPAAEAYAGLFGYPAREWAAAPLNELVRLYPLGIEGAEGDLLHVRSPIRVEADGSFRMTVPVPEGSVTHVLLSSASACIGSVQLAAREALGELEDARPALALVLVDIAWGMLMEAQPGGIVRALREVIGAEVPVAGGYTYGQIARSPATGQFDILNQHIQVVLFGPSS